jgi:branched-chain amino acid transport system permease protein
LLLDEPAAGLRHQEKQALAAVLRQLSRNEGPLPSSSTPAGGGPGHGPDQGARKREGISILLVEHDMDFVMGLTDRIVVMEFGTKLIEGTPAEVQASPAVRAAYLGTEH